MGSWSVVNLSELRGTFRLDAEFWQPEHLEVEAALLRQPHAKLGELVTGIRKGVFNILADSYVEEGVPFYRSSNVGQILPKEGSLVFITPKRHAEESKTTLRRGDIMLAKTGKEAACVVIRDECNVSQDVIAIRPNRQRINPFYLAVFLNTRPGMLQMRRWFQGQVQYHLSLPDARQVLVPLPSEKLQLGIESKVLSAEKLLKKASGNFDEAANLLASKVGLAGLEYTTSLYYERSFEDLQAASRFDAEYFSPRYQYAFEILRKSGRPIRAVANLVEHRFRPEKLKSSDTFQYIEIGSVRGDGVTDSETVEVSEAPSRAQWIAEPGDVITSTVRPIRRLTALITPEQSGYVCSSGFAVLRPKKGSDGIEPEVLLTFLRLPIICEILDLHTTASMYPAISTSRLMEIPIAVPKQSVRDEIVSKVRAALKARAEAANLLEQAKAEVECLVLGEAK
ncbi:MAG: hypothetical protein Q7U07_05175 [Gammaproteobacteria bacterium]|nr:hypothetical protein [Gammaproteobacteria bacterium]